MILSPSSIVEIEINGTGGGSYDQLAVARQHQFHRWQYVERSSPAGYTPTVNDNFANVVTYGSRSGTNTFTNINLSFAGTFTPTYTGANLSLLFSSLNVTNTWTDSTGDHNWLTPANWSRGTVPVASEDVVLALGTNVDIPSGTQLVNKVTSTEPLNIVGGATLDLAAASTFGANLTLAGTLQGTGAATFTSGTIELDGRHAQGQRPLHRKRRHAHAG